MAGQRDTSTRSIIRSEDGALAGMTVYVFGTGPLGLMTTFGLARNGAELITAADQAIEKGVGFVNAAGLFEPVATSDLRQAPWLLRGLEFCRWAQPDPAWGIQPREVLFLSDHESLVEQDWMVQMPSYRRADDAELRAGRKHGAWFQTYVIQPDLALEAISRELKALDAIPNPIRLDSVERAAVIAKESGADYFVLALGLGLAELQDIDRVADKNAGLSAGVGVTIRMPSESVGLDHVIMDADELGYLIPQRTAVIGGGTNTLMAYDDAVVTGADSSDAYRILKRKWVEDVRHKVARLWPPASGISGEIRIGARPLRHEVLTIFTDEFEVPGLILGGAGGSGWTFSVGIAEDVCSFVAEREGKAALRAIYEAEPPATERRPDAA